MPLFGGRRNGDVSRGWAAALATVMEPLQGGTPLVDHVLTGRGTALATITQPWNARRLVPDPAYQPPPGYRLVPDTPPPAPPASAPPPQ